MTSTAQDGPGRPEPAGRAHRGAGALLVTLNRQARNAVNLAVTLGLGDAPGPAPPGASRAT